MTSCTMEYKSRLIIPSSAEFSKFSDTAVVLRDEVACKCWPVSAGCDPGVNNTAPKCSSVVELTVSFCLYYHILLC
jgi:hypothetical protein